MVGQDVIEAAKLNIAELSDEDVDLLILAHLHQHRDDTAETAHTASHTKTHVRKRAEVIWRTLLKLMSIYKLLKANLTHPNFRLCINAETAWPHITFYTLTVTQCHA